MIDPSLKPCRYHPNYCRMRCFYPAQLDCLHSVQKCSFPERASVRPKSSRASRPVRSLSLCCVRMQALLSVCLLARTDPTASRMLYEAVQSSSSARESLSALPCQMVLLSELTSARPWFRAIPLFVALISAPFSFLLFYYFIIFFFNQKTRKTA